MDSTHQRFFLDVRTIHPALYAELLAHRPDGSFISDFQFLSPFLSPVRNQRKTGSCTYVSAVTCPEMMYRIGARSINGMHGRYMCFDVQDCFEHTYKNEELCLKDVEERLADTMGAMGTEVVYVLEFMVRRGLLSSCVCTDPQEKNPALLYAPSPNRNILRSYKKLQFDHVFEQLDKFPVIALLRSYDSFKDCTKVFFNGPTTMDSWIYEEEKENHAVVLVGRFILVKNDGDKQFVIIQNSHGKEFGFRGYVCAEFTRKLFVEEEFYMPLI